MLQNKANFLRCKPAQKITFQSTRKLFLEASVNDFKDAIQTADRYILEKNLGDGGEKITEHVANLKQAADEKVENQYKNEKAELEGQKKVAEVSGEKGEAIITQIEAKLSQLEAAHNAAKAQNGQLEKQAKESLGAALKRRGDMVAKLTEKISQQLIDEVATAKAIEIGKKAEYANDKADDSTIYTFDGEVGDYLDSHIKNGTQTVELKDYELEDMTMGLSAVLHDINKDNKDKYDDANNFMQGLHDKEEYSVITDNKREKGVNIDDMRQQVLDQLKLVQGTKDPKELSKVDNVKVLFNKIVSTKTMPAQLRGMLIGRLASAKSPAELSQMMEQVETVYEMIKNSPATAGQNGQDKVQGYENKMGASSETKYRTGGMLGGTLLGSTVAGPLGGIAAAGYGLNRALQTDEEALKRAGGIFATFEQVYSQNKEQVEKRLDYITLQKQLNSEYKELNDPNLKTGKVDLEAKKVEILTNQMIEQRVKYYGLLAQYRSFDAENQLKINPAELTLTAEEIADVLEAQTKIQKVGAKLSAAETNLPKAKESFDKYLAEGIAKVKKYQEEAQKNKKLPPINTDYPDPTSPLASTDQGQKLKIQANLQRDLATIKQNNKEPAQVKVEKAALPEVTKRMKLTESESKQIKATDAYKKAISFLKEKESIKITMDSSVYYVMKIKKGKMSPLYTENPA